MKKRRVLLLCAKHLLGEALENLLRTLEDVDLVGPWVLDESVIERISDHKPDVILIAEDTNQHEEISALTTVILERFPNLPIITSTLTQKVVRVYTSHELPARTDDLLNIIRKLPA